MMSSTGCPDTLRPPLHSITGQGHTPNLYIFMIPHQFQIYMQDFRSPTWFTYFRWHELWCGVEHIFVNKFCLFFGGALTKMAIKLSIIGADPYMIPHLKANIFRHEVKPYLGYCHNYVWFCRHFIESNVSNQQLDFLKKCPDTLRPPYPAKLRSDIHKWTIIQQTCTNSRFIWSEIGGRGQYLVCPPPAFFTAAELFTSLLESYPARLAAVKKAGGGHTKFWPRPPISLQINLELVQVCCMIVHLCISLLSFAG